jgi:hypothetical protein
VGPQVGYGTTRWRILPYGPARHYYAEAFCSMPDHCFRFVHSARRGVSDVHLQDAPAVAPPGSNLGNVQAARTGRASYSKRVLRRNVYRSLGKGLRGVGL